MKTVVLGTLLMFSLLAFEVTAAGNEYEDVMYLNDGSVIRGIIVERVPGETYKIEIAGGSVLVVDADEVERIAKERRATETDEKLYVGHVWGYRPFLFAFQPVFGMNIEGGESLILYGAEFKVGYRVIDLYAAGLGFGYNRLDEQNRVPIYFHNRLTYYRTSSTGIYTYINVGYGMMFADYGDGNYGGMMFGLGEGFEIGGPKFHVDISFGLYSQGYSYWGSLNHVIFKTGISL
jgi:hypothetical protein